MKSAMKLFRHFSSETSFHGFRRLWVGSRVRWPFWMLLICIGIGMSVYQILNKFQILLSNPMTINVDIKYLETMEFPAVTICNKRKIRISYLLNNTALLSMLPLFLPQDTDVKTTGNIKNFSKAIINDQVVQSLTAKNFFMESGIPKDQFILWCRLPNGGNCSSDDFDVTLTDYGFCLQFKKQITLMETGRGNGLKLLLNLAQYERISDSDELSETTLVIHNHDQDPMPSKGYDLMSGYQVTFVLRKTEDSQLGNCQPGNPLRYYEPYTYPSCIAEHALIDQALHCKCKPYTLKAPKIYNATVDGLPDCKLIEHFECIERRSRGRPTGNETVKPVIPSAACNGECVRHDYEHEIYYNLFRDSLSTFTNYIDKKKEVLQNTYHAAKDAGAYLNFYYNLDADYEKLFDISKDFNDLIVAKGLVPPYGSVAKHLNEKLHCLTEEILTKLNFSAETTRDYSPEESQTINADVDRLNHIITEVETKLDSLEIETIFVFANRIKSLHLNTCTKSNSEFCTLAALYDLIALRIQLTEKSYEINTVSNGVVKNFTEQTKSFVETANGTFFEFGESSRKQLKRMLYYYVDRANYCLYETGRILYGLLITGQPSMRNASGYSGFLSDLNSVNSTIVEICGQIDESAEMRFNVSGRRNLVAKIRQYLRRVAKVATTNIRFRILLDEMAAEMAGKLSSTNADQFYNHRLLKIHLEKIKTVDSLLSQYLNQRTGEIRIKKSQFQKMLENDFGNFQDGLKFYKIAVSNQLTELSSTFQMYIENLIKIYPGSDEDLHWLPNLLAGINEIPSEARRHGNERKTLNETELFVSYLVCLTNAKNVIQDIAKSKLDNDSLNSYENSVKNLKDMLKLYIDDIQFNTSYRKFINENLGMVKIYIRDLGLKKSTQERSYDYLSFLCDIGGIVGLWLGGSLVSLIEIFDILCFERIKHWKCRRKFQRSYPLSKRNDGKRHHCAEIPSTVTTPRNSDLQSVGYKYVGTPRDVILDTK